MSTTSTSLAGQRIAALLDDNSFVEIGALVTARATDFNMKQNETPADGVITGYGVIDGNLVYVYSQDASVAPVLREALARFLSTFVPQWSVPQEPFTDWYFMALQPSPFTFHYTQPVVLLVDWGVGSAGEPGDPAISAAILRRAPRSGRVEGVTASNRQT